jgi:hypothetical protein
MVCGAFSLVIVLAGYFINPEVENNHHHTNNIGILANLKRNSLEIKEAIKIPTIYKTIAFFLLSGLLVPTYSDIGYYFNLNVV